MSCDGCGANTPVLKWGVNSERMPSGGITGWGGAVRHFDQESRTWGAALPSTEDAIGDEFSFVLTAYRAVTYPGECGGTGCVQVRSCGVTFTIWANATIRTWWDADDVPKPYPSGPVVTAEPNLGQGTSTGFVPLGKPYYDWGNTLGSFWRSTTVEGVIEITFEPGCGTSSALVFDENDWVVTAGGFGTIPRDENASASPFSVTCSCVACAERTAPTTITQGSGENAREYFVGELP